MFGKLPCCGGPQGFPGLGYRVLPSAKWSEAAPRRSHYSRRSHTENEAATLATTVVW